MAIPHIPAAMTSQECRAVLHDLKNYLFMLDSALAILQLHVDTMPDAQAREVFAAAKHSAERIRKIVTSTHEKPSVFSPGSLFLSVACEFKEPGLDIFFESRVDNALVTAKHTDIARIVRNILENALEAMSRQKTKVVRATVSLDIDNICLRIFNTGPQIHGGAEGREAIFVEGYSTKELGSGIGLAASRRLAVANGGTLDVKNCKGGGVAFSLRLPRSAP